MGERLLPADRGNPHGYFEDLRFLDLDRRMLVACTRAEEGHRDWGWTESETFDASPLPAFRSAADELIAERDQARQPWGWKDPRTSLLLDFWDGRLGGETRYLFVYRYPWEVADSMQRTGAAVWLNHPEYAARIWTYYNRRILDFHRQHRDRSLLVSTNQLLNDPPSFAALLRKRFGVDADAETISRLWANDSFVSTPAGDPLPRLWRFAHRNAMDLLDTLDDAADIGNERGVHSAQSAVHSALRPTPPRLSVVIPCHDDGEYLIDAAASVERNAPAAELIIVDDGSTQPRTREVLDAMRAAGHQVIEQPQSGLSAARNAGVGASSGEYFLPLDADNRLLPGFVDEAVRLLEADPAAGVAYGDRREFGARSGDVVQPELDLPRLLWSNYIDACAVVRRTLCDEVGGYDPALRDWEDWDFWLRAAERGSRFIRIPGAAFEYRVRPDSLQHRFLRSDAYFPTLHRIYEKHRRSIEEQTIEALESAHSERRQLFRDIEALRDARDVLQENIDRLAGVAPAIPPPIDAPLSQATRVFTIIARNYFAYARVLAESLARHNPGTKLHVVVLDDLERQLAPDASMEIIHAGELPFDPPSDFHTMAAIYDVTELATAVKPWAFEHLFARGAEAVLYLDPDIEVFDCLGPLEPLTREHGMVLTPHVTAPLPRDGKRPDERDLLLAGIYNLGFLALSSEGAARFLPWWRERLRRDCINDPANGVFVDQRWIDFAPAFFDAFILQDPGFNVAYWNLPNRALTRCGDRVHAGDRPLRFFHFSGFSPRTPHVLSKHQHEWQRVRVTETPLLAELCERYAAALTTAGSEMYSTLPYGFAATAAGFSLDTWARRSLRRTYLADEASGATSFPDPFSSSGADDVIERLRRGSPHAPLVSEWLFELWSARADLRAAFPDIGSVDAERYLEWVRTQGVREHDIPQQLVPPKREEPDTRASGVNVYGYAFAESGTGQIVRSVVSALAAEAIPYVVVPFTRTVTRQQQAFDDLGTGVPRFDTNLICVNADQVPVFFENMGSKLPRGARNIGLWAWEVEDLPPAMAQSARYLDEVWGISEFTAKALARSITKPVRAFPLPVVVPRVQRRTRAELGMPEGFLFLFCFDYDSVFRRKNPLATVAAFKQAFGDRDDVALFIKTTNAGRHARDEQELQAAAAGRSNIVIRDAYVTSDHYFSMLDACDCYVSLHRSEGFGLTVAEAMGLGKPVISTAYSSTSEFANESNSFPVPVRMVAVGDDAPPYPPRSRWAEPDVTVAAQQMAKVFGDREAAASIGAKARADIEQLHSPSARGPLLLRLFEESHQTPQTADADPCRGRLSAGPGQAKSLPLHEALRDAAIRFIRVPWVQQLGVDRAILAAARALRLNRYSR
jgi:glycosyltransferase involved in cell wall biosynthesis/GT2 family glycosyltransferase